MPPSSSSSAALWVGAFALSLVASLTGSPARAQQGGTPREPSPDGQDGELRPGDLELPPLDPNPAEPGDEVLPPAEEEAVEVERPEEIERIRSELERIESVRRRMTKGPSVLRVDSQQLAGKELSPVLAPRREVLPISLEMAIGEALTNNPDYLIQLLATRAAGEAQVVERALFDPVLSTRAVWVEARTPFFSANPFSGFPVGLNVAPSESLDVRTAISQRLPIGTQLELAWVDRRTKTANVFALNPSYSPSLELNFTQPLLRGFGLEANLAGLRVARNQALQSDADLATTYMDAALGIEQTYWDLVRTEQDLRFQERSLSSAIQFLEDQRRLEEFGAGTRLDVTIAKSGVAQQREAVIVAENALETARDNLIRLTRPASDPDKWDLFVVPTDLPQMIDEPPGDAASAIQTALRRRPDYWQALLALDSAERSLAFAENQALPTLNFIGGWRQEGLDDTHHSSWSALGSGRFYTWQVGVELELPLFLRAERSRVRQAKFDLERARATLAALEAQVVLEVRRAARDLRTSRARIEAARAARVLAEERLEATREMLKAGTAVPRDVLEDLALLAQAESSEVQSFINYRLAISRLVRAQGTILDGWLDRLDPRVRRALDRTPIE